jgi:hypothetical protein
MTTAVRHGRGAQDAAPELLLARFLQPLAAPAAHLSTQAPHGYRRQAGSAA